MSFFKLILLFSAMIVPLAASGAATAEQDDSRLTIDRIYDSKEFTADRLSAKWLSDSSGYTTLEDAKDESGGRDIVLHSLQSEDTPKVLVSAEDLVPAGENNALSIDDYTWSDDMSLLLIYTNSKRVWRQKTRGDYWVLDRSSHELRQLGGKARPASLMFAKFSPAGRQVAYVRDRNIYVEDLLSHEIRPLTKSATESVINGTFDWVYEEEFSLRDGFRWSGDGKRVAFWQLDTKGVREFPLVNNTKGLYPRIQPIPYPKVGQKNPSCRVGVVEVASGDTTWIQLPGDSRENYIARMQWAEGLPLLLLQQLNRRQNTNRVFFADVKTGEATVVMTEQDDAWVDVNDDLQWLSDDSQFCWLSERDGWRHLYLVTRDGQQKRVTKMDYDIIDFLHWDPRHGAYFLASPQNATQKYLYLQPPDGGSPRRLSPRKQSGTHSYDISPDGRFAVHSYSSFDRPPRTDLISLPDHKRIRKLASNKELRKKLNKLNLKPTEFFRVDIGNDVLLDGWCIKPAAFDQSRTYPLLIHVYGEPAGRTVLDRWGGNGFLWHQMLAQHGYVIMSFDNRGTPAPRGRAWRKCIYKQVGILAPQDQAAALQAVLQQRPYLDPKRVGIWGWSGGGSMALNGIFKYPDLYRTAISIAPVPNQRYYDTIYQERYMGLPADNVEGFREGSPINFAHQLKGNLLVIHGTGDDNCHYQGTEALINKLIRHNKQFSMMAYPNRSHAIREGKNTTRHLRQLMMDYLLRNLPPTNAIAQDAAR